MHFELSTFFTFFFFTFLSTVHYLSCIKSTPNYSNVYIVTETQPQHMREAALAAPAKGKVNQDALLP